MTAAEILKMIDDEEMAALAEKYVWSVHGRGASTSVGHQTRQLIRDAFAAGFVASQEAIK